MLGELSGHLDSYLASLESIDPDRLCRAEALAFWINLYNAGGLRLAAEANLLKQDSVLRVPGGFQRSFVTIAGEELSLDAIEHAKVRRFGDPRIHGALVCGSVSCPTLRGEPYRGDAISSQLDDQMRRVLARGGLVRDEHRKTVSVSRIFLWYGGDFVRPHRMPSLLPATAGRVLGALRPWIEPEVGKWIEAADPAVKFQDYDWGLACAVG